MGKIQQKEKGNALIISELPFDFRDSVGIRQNHVLSGGIGYFTGRNNVV